MRILTRLYSLGEGDSFGVTLKALLADPGPGGHGDLQQPATGRVFHWVAQPTRDSSGGTVGLTFTFQDVTPTRDLVRQLEDKSRLLDEARRKAEEVNRAKGEFLANVTHEVRTPLSAIIGMTALLNETDVARRIRTAAESLLTVISDILDFSKIDSRKLTLEREPLELRGVLQDVLDTVQISAVDKGLALLADIADEVPDALLGDALRLRQVLLNLIGNAIKFTEQGEIRVRVNVASALPGEVCLHFAVIDTGIGIPRDKQELVFEAFAQADGTSARRFGGTGLGLSISARLVELMGGDIWVESEVGRGSAFRFTANFGLPGALSRRLIELFMQDSTRLVDDIGRAIAARDVERLRRAAHTLKGFVSHFPAGAARETAARMEAIGLDGDFEAAGKMFPTLEKEVDRLRSVLPTLV
jgi:signal transduction histidine kinase/HPt (histidine-containing phosphotransfer) domain-containing protein